MPVALVGDLVSKIGFKTRKIGLGDEVDDTRNGVGTIGGRCAASQDFHTLDQGQWNVVEIESAVQFSWNDAYTVQQHDVTVRTQATQTVRTQATQVDERETTIAVVHGRADARNDPWNLAKQFFCHVGLLQIDFISSRNVNRRR
ncbi:hypothetical protein BF95_19790 [Sphingobium sp. Ant17]|nr:hypothetical protein BF95_19790 [Sphingobium sp. Ant17]